MRKSIKSIYICAFFSFFSCYHPKEKVDFTILAPLLQKPFYVTLVGDSLANRSDGFALQEKLGSGFSVTNYAIDGRTCRDWLSEIHLVFDPAPDLLIIELGTNDAIQYSGQEFQKNIQLLWQEIQLRSRAQIFNTAMPLTEEASIQDRIRQNNLWLVEQSQASHFVLVDLASLFSEQEETIDFYPSFDPIHPNPVGYDIIGSFYQKQILLYLQDAL